MTHDQLIASFPHLFNEVLWSWGPTRAKFELSSILPSSALIANVNLVPYIGDRWGVIQLEDGSWDIPGGTLEPHESVDTTIQRELLEEAGAELITFRLIGAWHCFSLSQKPFKPHLPFPEYFRVVGVGEIKISGIPTNPPGAEQVAKFELLPIKTVIDQFTCVKRNELAELYQLAGIIKDTQ